MMVSVIGGEDAPTESLNLAEEVGRELARRGATVVCGGRGGIVEAACRGARSAGGHTVGILPGRHAAETPPNAYVEFPVFTGLGHARNVIVALSGEAVIAIGGAYGTLSEIAFALIHDIPLVALHTWDFSYEGHESERIIRAQDPVAAVEMAITLAKQRRTTVRKE